MCQTLTRTAAKQSKKQRLTLQRGKRLVHRLSANPPLNAVHRVSTEAAISRHFAGHAPVDGRCGSKKPPNAASPHPHLGPGENIKLERGNMKGR